MKLLNNIWIVLITILVINIFGNQWFFRKDLTADQRYTLSNQTIDLLNKINKPININVYLKGNFPLDFKRLGTATKEHLEELQNINPKLRFKFIDPSGNEEELIKKGFEPSQLTIEENGEVSQKLIFPYAIINVGKKQQIINLLSSIGNSQQEQLQNAIENIEFMFSDALKNLTIKQKQNIAILHSHGTLNDIYLFDWLSNIKKKYNLAPFTLTPKNTEPQKILTDLKQYKALVIAKPTERFTESEKYILDQYIMQGGKTLWMIDATTIEMDSIQIHGGSAMALPLDLNLTDLLFNYGTRINHDLVEDLYGSKIALATGEIAGKTQFTNALWPYYPLVMRQNNNPIAKNLEPIRLKFASSIDTLPLEKVKKTLLLQSSTLSKKHGLPFVVSLSSVAEKVNPKEFNSDKKTLAVLLEGKFPSAYKFRTKPFNYDGLTSSKTNKIIIISDGDIGANQIQNNQPTPLDVDKWTGQTFGNKTFLTNALNYLMDDNDLLSLRRKTIKLTTLNKETIATQKSKWQFINIGFPLFLILIFGITYKKLHQRKYTK